MKKEISQYLMSYDEYGKNKHQVPYKYFINKNGQVLYYFGANHSRDPQNEQYKTLKDFWNDFLINTKKDNSIVLVEGGKRKISLSEEDAILNGAEGNFITYLSSKEGIETFSPEPVSNIKFEELLKNFTKEEVSYYFFSRTVLQWNRHHKEKPDFENYINNLLKRHQENIGWPDFDFSIDHMIKIQKEMFNRDFNKNDEKFYFDITNPITNFSRINQLSRLDSDLRDKYILEQIEELWMQGKNIFIVYGFTHAIMQEPAIRRL